MMRTSSYGSNKSSPPCAVLISCIFWITVILHLSSYKLPKPPPTENPAFHSYHKQDQLIVAWLLAAMTSLLLTKMVGLETSAQIWHRLLTHYASHTRAMVKKFRMLLKTPKNDRSISTYLNDIKKVANSLAAVGSPLSTVDHIDAILDGLFADFDGFITSVLSRSDPYSVDDLEALLLAQKAQFDKHKLSHDTLLQVNTVSTPTPWQFKTQNKKKFHSYTPRGGHSTNSSGPSFSSSRTRPSSPQPSPWTSVKLSCQICHKPGHTADTC